MKITPQRDKMRGDRIKVINTESDSCGCYGTVLNVYPRYKATYPVIVVLDGTDWDNVFEHEELELV